MNFGKSGSCPFGLASFFSFLTRALLRLAHQHMHVIGHHYVAHEKKSILSLDSSEFLHENVARLYASEQRQPSITIEGHKVELALSVVALQSLRHPTPKTPALTTRGRGTLLTPLHRDLQK